LSEWLGDSSGGDGLPSVGFGVLGPLEVIRAGHPVAVNAPKLRVLLAALLVQANKSLSIDQLAERLWGEEPPSTARKAIQLYILRLRRLLGDDTGDPELILTRPHGYLIRLEPDQLDLHRFTRLIAAARSAAKTGDLTAESIHLTEALSCWRGAALSDVPSESLQREVVAQLAEARLRSTERRMQVLLELGRHKEIISELVQLTKDHPWQEQFWVQLILALHRSDRLADALDTYRTVHRKFRTELGIDPGEQLQNLHRTILAGAMEAEPRHEAEPAPDRLAAQICQLPARVRGFVGRDALVDRLTGLLTANSDTANVAVVSGPPGVGKTAFALHVAHRLRPRFADGQLYVNLRGYSADPPLTPVAVLTRFLRALGVPADHVPADEEDQASLYRSLLADRNMLVLLDNAAHPDQVRALLPGGQNCAVLVTSRNDLRGLAASQGVDHVPLGVLTAAQSQAVLTDLVGEARAAAEPDALRALANACAHLPLALRIAGANLAADPHRSIDAYTTELDQYGRVGQLTVDGDERSAVRVAFDRSYLSLPEEDRRVFRLLGLAPGPDVSGAAAAALADLPVPATLLALDRLTAANLLHQHAPGRYQLHDLIREYAADRARDEDTALTRILNFYLHTADAATLRLYSGLPRLPLPSGETEFRSDVEALRWLDDERHNLFAAVSRAADTPSRYPYAWQLVDVLRGYLQARGDTGEALAGCEAALKAAANAGDLRAEISVLDILGTIFYNRSDYPRAVDYHRRSLAAGKQLGDLDVEARALHSLGRVYAQSGLAGQALDCHQQALALSRRSGNRDAEVLALNYIGVAHTAAGRPRKALDWHRRSLILSREIGNREATFRALNALGIAYWALGQLDKAIEHHEEVLTYCRQIGQGVGEMITLVCLAEANADAGRHELALAQAGEAIGWSIRLGERRSEAGALEVIATVRHRLGQHRSAVETYTKALQMARDISFGYGETSILIGLAGAHRCLGDPALGLSLVSEALVKLSGDGTLVLEVAALTELARNQLALGEPIQAREHIGRAIKLAADRGQRIALHRAEPVLEQVNAALAAAEVQL
jgi:DNA-binding SARP family transcriptional activator/tetratricopeptide (TPR) repeat protein